MQTIIPHSTPWGPAQHETQIAEGVVSVSTAGHGGYYVEPAINATIPAYLRSNDGWYEEDCDWSKAHVALGIEDRATECAHKTFKNWHPDEWEKFTGKILAEGESSTRDRRVFMDNAKDSFVVICAWGSWKEGVPSGTVTVAARLGGRDGSGDSKYFSVGKAEYDTRSEFGFVIDPAKHKEVAAL